MIVVMRTTATQTDIDRVLQRLAEQSCRGELTIGVERTIITAVGPLSPALEEDVQVLPEVDKVVRLGKSYHLASSDAAPGPTVVQVAGVPIGGAHFALIAGPATVESEQQVVELAPRLRAAGAALFSGGTTRPGDSPYAFRGLGPQALAFLEQARTAGGLPVVSEAPNVADLDAVARAVDLIEIGAVNMRNAGLLEAAAAAGKPVLLRRAADATLDDWLLAAERLLYAGLQDVVLCESGIRTYESAAPTTADISAIPMLKRLTHLPVVIDPAHSSGDRSLVEALSLAAVAAGADGLYLPVHPDPDHALADGDLSLSPDDFAALVAKVQGLVAVTDRRLAEAPQRGG